LPTENEVQDQNKKDNDDKLSVNEIILIQPKLKVPSFNVLTLESVPMKASDMKPKSR